MKESTFFKETFRLYNQNKKLFAYRLKSNKLSIVDKNLLKAYVLYRRKKFDKCIDLLRSTSTVSPFQKGFKLYLKALLQSHQTKFRLANNNAFKSMVIFEKINDDFITSALILLCIININKKDTKKLALYIRKLELYSIPSEYIQISTFQVKAMHAFLTGNLNKANDEVNQALFLMNDTSPHTAEFLLLKLNISIVKKDYKNSYKIFNQYKKNSSFKTNPNNLFIHAFLDYIVYAKPIYLYQKDFLKYPELWSQVLTIKALSVGNHEDALKSWSNLSIHNPSLYQDDFNYNSVPCLFSIALKMNKVEKLRNIKSLNIEVIEKISSITQKCFFILKELNIPISKYDLIMLIWGTEYSDSMNARLRNTIKNCKRKYDCEIVSYQETYQLKEKDDSKEVA